MNNIRLKLTLGLCAVALAGVSYSQQAEESVDKKVLNWYNGGKAGMNTEKAYKKVKNRTSKTVVVAIIDSGMDIEHKDLAGKIWVNKGEIAGNGIDDDNNGYIDDVHGWNFLGNANGENANDIRLEKTRIYAKLKKKYDGKDVIISNEEEAAEFVLYQKVKEEVESELAAAKGNLQYYEVMLPAMIDNVPTYVGKALNNNEYTMKDLKSWKVAPGSQDAQMKEDGHFN